MTTHKKSYTKIYRKWTSMLSRCRNEKDPNYINYGERGIFVCDKWHDFESFFNDMGDIPSDDSQLDRINNNDGYYKENCRWVLPKENSRNRRSTKRHTTDSGLIVQQELIEIIGWTKNQFRWFRDRYGVPWILENFQKGTLPQKTNIEITRNDLEGREFGYWHVLNFQSYTKKTGHLYLCRCKCGVEKLIPRDNLLKKKSLSCRPCSTKRKWEERNGLHSQPLEN